MSDILLKEIEDEIALIKNKLQHIGEMRPGSLNKQYRVPKEKKGGFYQLNYTHKMQSYTKYVRLQFVDEIKDQLAAYKDFKAMTNRWVELAILHSTMKMDLEKKKRGK